MSLKGASMESHTVKPPYVDQITKEKIEGLAGALDDSLEDVYPPALHPTLALHSLPRVEARNGL